MTPEPLSALATVLLLAATLLGLLVGIWLGFAICARDARLLARFAVDARDARELAERTAKAQRALGDEVTDALARAEHKRASAAATLSKAERARAVEEDAPPPAPLEGRERRRAIGRALQRGGTIQ